MAKQAVTPLGRIMTLDLPTLTAAAAFATMIAAVMLLLTWWRSRAAITLGLWGAALLVVDAGGVVLALRGLLPLSWSVVIGGDLLLFGYGLMWCAAGLFEGRRPRWFAAAAGAVVWTLACQSAAFMADMSVRIELFSLLAGAYTLLTASEYWRACDRTLTLRWPAIALLVMHAALIAARGVLADAMPMPAVFTGAASAWLIAGIAAMLAHYVCMAFIVLAMAKERVAIVLRREAHSDPLTGIANRRSFYDSGENLLRYVRQSGRPVALLLFDLDMFKHINDTFGHQTGDRVLCAFACTAATALRPSDILGRLGGEEFACLLPGLGAKQAMRVAERIRADFAARVTAVHGAPATVSVGVATTSDANGDLDALIAAADRALYRVKDAGRNRVEQAHEGLPAVEAA
jgi:diguanylate cyclase (GGDEF)-like protein